MIFVIKIFQWLNFVGGFLKNWNLFYSVSLLISCFFAKLSINRLIEVSKSLKSTPIRPKKALASDGAFSISCFITDL